VNEYLDLPAVRAARGTVALPGSKSISNRTLLLAALAEGVTEVRGLLASDDTERMLDALRLLGVAWTRVAGTDDYRVPGAGGKFAVRDVDLFLGNAGTAFRPLTAALALAGGSYRLSGVARMHERPIGDLVDALRQLGAHVDYLGNAGFPPLAIHPARIAVPPRISVRGDVSSQFLTALLMALPLAGQAVTVEVAGELISRPYVEITLNLLRRFGIEVARDGWQRFHLPAGACYLSPGTIQVEGDASSASYFLAAGAVGGGPVRVTGVGRVAETLAAMGASVTYGEDWIEARRTSRLTAIDADLNHIPDAAMTVAVLALFAEGTTTIRNVASWRVKETDRLAAMATELRKVGATVEEGTDYLRVTPPAGARLAPNAQIATYDDHRMAMCFSLVSLAGVPVRILDPKCVNKTFPGYFDEFATIVE